MPESLKEKAKRIKECELQLSEYRKIIDAQESSVAEQQDEDYWTIDQRQ